ncbi:MAG: radical SAM protein [Candidatus Omnitrophica bacterium]|nr:radical SAM protein [Candidatus Omnitrophota bacterium]
MRKTKENKKVATGDIRLVLLATRACCLNCQYCFVKRTNELMSQEVLKKAIDFLFTSESQNLQLQFFGGEPLMLPDDRFKWSIQYAIAKAKRAKKNLKIIITTNAVYLTQKKIGFLKKYKNHIIIEVSLDGKKESHNTNRPQKDKTSRIDSYSMITKNFPAIISSCLYSRVSMVVSPHTAKDLLENFEHLLGLGFNKIWLMLSCGVLWGDQDIKEFERQLQKIGEKYYEQIKEGKILLMNLRDWFAPYRMNSELIVDLNGRIYPACMNYLVDDEKVKEKYCLGGLNDSGFKNIDYYERKRISNQEAIDVFFRVNKIIPNYKSNIKTGMMINGFVKKMNNRLKGDGVDISKFFNEYKR